MRKLRDFTRRVRYIFFFLMQCVCRGSIQGGRFISIDEYELTVLFFKFILTSFPFFCVFFLFVFCLFAVFQICPTLSSLQLLVRFQHMRAIFSILDFSALCKPSWSGVV